MGVTKIWAIKDSLSRVVGYAENAEKTEFSDMQQVLHYAQNGEKVTSGPEKTMYVTTSRPSLQEGMLPVGAPS